MQGFGIIVAAALGLVAAPAEAEAPAPKWYSTWSANGGIFFTLKRPGTNGQPDSATLGVFYRDGQTDPALPKVGPMQWTVTEYLLNCETRQVAARQATIRTVSGREIPSGIVAASTWGKVASPILNDFMLPLWCSRDQTVRAASVSVHRTMEEALARLRAGRPPAP